MSKPRTGMAKRTGAGLLAGALAVFGIALASPSGATDVVTSERLAGATRYGTAAAVAGDEAFAAPTTAIVASGEDSHLADALAASTLAGANAPAPIVITQTATYTADAKAALAGLKGKGVSSVTIVGGTAAVTTAVEDAIKADGFTVTRVAGVDRFATAAAIATAADAKKPAAPVEGLDTALIASGTSFADALAGSPAAANLGLPMLLVNADAVPQATSAAITALGIKKAVVLGGTVPVSEAVASQLATATGNPVTRLAGVDRFATAAAIGDYEQDTLGFAATSAVLANGLTLVDALTAGPLAGILEAPIVLTASLPAPSQAALDKWSDTIAKLYVIGGTAAVDAATLDAAIAAAQATSNDPATPGNSETKALVGPELQSVRIGGIDTDDKTIEYIFTFDGDVDDGSITESAFKLYNADTHFFATGDDEGTDADADGPEVAVTFDLGQYQVVDASLAAVEAGAVEDDEGNENPPQSVSISPLVGMGAPGGDLEDFEVADEEDGETTWTFSSPVDPDLLQDGALPSLFFDLILEDEDGVLTQISGDAAETTPDDEESSTTVMVTFDDDDDLDGEPDATEDNDYDIVRAILYKSDNVDGFGPDIVQSIDVSGGGDIEDAPDLESVEYPADNTALDDDEVLFTFDENVDTASAGDFNLYYGFCDPFDLGDGVDRAQQCVVPGTSAVIDGDEVTVTFSDEAVNDFIAGAFVWAGAVDLDTNDIEDDELNDTNWDEGILGDYAAMRGVVAGPQLAGVEIDTETDSFGDFDEFNVTFTFDKAMLDDDGPIAGFSIWFEEDGEVNEFTLDNCETDGDFDVVCTDDEEDSDIANAVVASVEYDSVLTEDPFDTGSGDAEFPNPEGSFEASPEAAA